MYQPDRDKKAIMPPPVVNDVVSPKLRKDAAMFAPITNYFSPDAAAGKLATSRLTRSGQPMPSTIGPPAPGALAQPPQQEFFQRYAPSSSANMAYGSTPRPGESNLGVLGRIVTGAAGMVTALPEAFATSLLQGGANSAKAWGGAIKDAYGGMTGAPVTPPAPIAQAPVPTPQPNAPATPMPAGARRTGGRPDLRQTPSAPTATPPVGTQPRAIIEYTGDGKSGKANAAAPGQVALSERTQQPLPGAPTVGADGSVQYDQAWADKNKSMLTRYAGTNVVQSVVPPPGVAQGMVSGQTGGVAALTRAPRGFTAADRAQQLDNLDRQGRDYAARSLSERAVRSARYGNPDAGALQEAANTAALAPPPRIQPLQRPDPNDAARLAMEQQQAALQAEQTQIGTQQQQLQLKQAQQMQALSQQLLEGTPEQKQAAATSLAALQGTKPGAPVKVKRQVPTGQVDALGQPVMGEEEVLYNPQTGQWMAPPAAGGGAGQPPQQAVDYLKQNDTPQTRAAFQAKYGVDPATILG